MLYNRIHFFLFTSQAVMEPGRRLNALMVRIAIPTLRALPAILSMELERVRQGVAEVSFTGIIAAMYRAIAPSPLEHTSLSTRTQATLLWAQTTRTVVAMLMSPITNSSFESHKAVLTTRIRGD